MNNAFCTFMARVPVPLHWHSRSMSLASPGAVPEPEDGGLLILDRGDVEVYGPNSKKGVLHQEI